MQYIFTQPNMTHMLAFYMLVPTCPKYSSCLSRTPCREETAPRQAEAKQPTMKSSWNSKCLSKSGWNQLGEHGEKICYTYTNILDLFVIIFLNLFIVVKLERLKRLLQVEAGWCQHHHLAKRFFNSDKKFLVTEKRDV